MKNIALRQLIKYKMKTLRESAQQALEALYNMVEDGDRTDKQQAMLAITALHTALEQPEQEPVEDVVAYHADGTRTVRISAQPPSEWVLVKKILDEYGLDAIAFVAEWKAAQPKQETQCKWPTCQNEEYQNTLAEQLKQEFVTGRPWVGLTPEDWEKIDDRPYAIHQAVAWTENRLRELNT
jgi:hypothetical protein